MKRILCIILAFAMLPVAAACQQQPSYTPLNFYYPRAEFAYGIEDGVIAAEIRTDLSYKSPSLLLSEYLEGPLGAEFTNPFPEGLKIVSVYTQSGTVYITLSDQLAQLSGVPLIIACACIAKTSMSLLKSANVQISCETKLLDGKKTVNINEQNIVFYDSIPTVTEPKEQE